VACSDDDLSSLDGEISMETGLFEVRGTGGLNLWAASSKSSANGSEVSRMTLLDIVLHPNDVLITPCQPVEVVDASIRKLVMDMAETMYDAPGVGLAAPQIGVLKRVTVIDITPKDEPKENLLVLINPEIIHREGDITWEEGCLSIPRVYEKIDRSRKVTVRALNIDGKVFEITGEGLLSVAMQHEIDHLDGILFFERMSRLKKKRAQKRYLKVLEELEYEREHPEEEIEI